MKNVGVSKLAGLIFVSELSPPLALLLHLTSQLLNTMPGNPLPT